MKPAVFDLDDLCDYWDPYDLLLQWKAENPNGKVTLFTIPKRCSPALLARYRALPWVELAVHGWWHQTGECLAWTSEDTAARLRWCRDEGYAPGFKAPGWLMTRETIDGCNEAGFWVAGHAEHRKLWQPGDVNYVYNRRRRTDDWTPMHGHTHNTMGNGIEEAFGRFCVPRETEFKFVSEVVCAQS